MTTVLTFDYVNCNHGKPDDDRATVSQIIFPPYLPAAAEAAHLCLFQYDELKSADKRKPLPQLSLVSGSSE